MSDLLRISIGIESDLYPELYKTLLPMGKGKRSEMLRVLAQEGLSLRRTNLAHAEVPVQAPAPTVSHAPPAANPVAPPNTFLDGPKHIEPPLSM